MVCLSEFRWASAGGLVGSGKGRRSNVVKRGRVKAEWTLGQPQQTFRKGSYHWLGISLLVSHYILPAVLWGGIKYNPYFSRQGPEAQRDAVICSGHLALRLQSISMWWHSSQYFSSAPWCQLSMMIMLCMGHPLFMPQASFFSLGETGPSLCGHQELAISSKMEKAVWYNSEQ